MSCLAITSTESAPRVRMFCFHNAGGGASFYHRVRKLIPADVDVVPVQLPGREERFREPAHTRLPDAVEEVSLAMSSYMDVPFVFFGHSMGGILAFEVARHFRDEGYYPLALFAAASFAPHQGRPDENLCDQTDEDLVDKVCRRYGGIPTEVLENKELLELALPILRADLSCLETYQYLPQEPLTCPIVALGGGDDKLVTSKELVQWQRHTSADFDLHMFEGDHFFLRPGAEAVFELVCEKIDQYLEDPAVP